MDNLTEALLTATEVGELNQIIDALGEIADPRASNAVSEFLYSGNRTLIISATRALGKLGTPTAMLRLAERMGTDNQLDMLILDIFAKVQDSISWRNSTRPCVPTTPTCAPTPKRP